MNVELLIDTAVTFAELRTVPLAWMMAPAHNSRLACVVGSDITLVVARPPAWTTDEDRFLAESLGHLHEDDIAATLGRTRTAVRLRWQHDLRLPAPTRHPDYIAATVAGQMLGLGSRTVINLVRCGILPGERVPCDRTLYRVRRATLRRWAVNPLNWVYFRPARIADPDLRRLVQRRAAGWPDAWLTVGEVAASLDLSLAQVNHLIHQGQLAAVRHGNYWVLRSEMECFRQERNAPLQSAAGSAFLILGRAVGLTLPALAAMMGLTYQQVYYRLRRLQAQGRIPKLIHQYGLQVEYRPTDGALLADWRDYTDRFPRLATILSRFAQDPDRAVPADLCTVRGVLATWQAWHAEQGRGPARSIPVDVLQAARQTLRERWHVDPLHATI